MEYKNSMQSTGIKNTEGNEDSLDQIAISNAEEGMRGGIVDGVIVALLEGAGVRV